MKLYMFRTVPLSIVRCYSLYTQQWYMSYRYEDSFRAGSGRNWVPSWCCSNRIRMELSSILILLESCFQTYMTYTIAECTVNNSWWWTEELYETCRVSFQNKFEKLVYLVGFIIRKFVTIHGHMNVKQRRKFDFFSKLTLVMYGVGVFNELNLVQNVDETVCLLNSCQGLLRR
jgi:hypothetical protein